MYNLFTTFYKSRSYRRQLELDYCLYDNCNNELFDNIYVFSEIDVKITPNVHIIKIDKKPTFETFFIFINSLSRFKKSINVIANADIIFDETLSHSEYYFQYTKPTVLALSKYDNYELGKNADYSQDVWIFNGHILPCVSADIQLGTNGCDNRIAYELNKGGYCVLNPSTEIKTYHVHNTGFRVYDKKYKPTEPMMNVKVI